MPQKSRPSHRSLLAAAVVLAFVVGIVVGSEGGVGRAALRVLATLGQPQYEVYRDLYVPEASGRTDHVVFLRGGGRAEAERFLAAHPEIELADQTVFANGIVLSIPEPVDPLVEALEAQPFVWLVLRDRPFFFCH